MIRFTRITMVSVLGIIITGIITGKGRWEEHGRDI